MIVNGKLIAEDEYLTNNFAPVGQRMKFGTRLDGVIDDIRLYDRILSEAEALSLR